MMAQCQIGKTSKNISDIVEGPKEVTEEPGFYETDRISKYFTALAFDVMVPRMLGAIS